MVLICLWITYFYSCNNAKHNVIIGQKISTSNYHIDYNATNLVDSNLEMNIWNNGRFGQDWIQIDFDKKYDVDSISFALVALPASTFTYSILAKKDGEDFENISSNSQFTQQSLPIVISSRIEDVTALKIVVKNDSSYTALYDLKVIGK